jgi:arsenate reductase
LFLGHTAVAHWGLPDPAEVDGDERAKRAAFRATLRALDRRLDHLVALPWDRLEGSALATAVNALARD